jgi:hypothetical protein
MFDAERRIGGSSQVPNPENANMLGLGRGDVKQDETND